MKDNINFYENIHEARMRLNNTVVMYDDEPYHVVNISDHKNDNIFRMYLDPLNLGTNGSCYIKGVIPPLPGDSRDGDILDEFLSKNPDSSIIRKMMNSPLFNKFRPFPLGMLNDQGFAYYLQRQPTRSTLQGLVNHMIQETEISAKMLLEETGGSLLYRSDRNVYNKSFYNCIKGFYPTYEECFVNLRDPQILNHSVAFHRHFALLRLRKTSNLCLSYKTSVVGTIEGASGRVLKLSSDFLHLYETISELGIFNRINYKEED